MCECECECECDFSKAGLVELADLLKLSEFRWNGVPVIVDVRIVAEEPSFQVVEELDFSNQSGVNRFFHQS